VKVSDAGSSRSIASLTAWTARKVYVIYVMFSKRRKNRDR
jgi:hypothetical protein